MGLIGCGRWGALILRDLRSLECEVVVIARGGGSRERAIGGGATAVVSSVSELGRVDGVIVSTPTSSHADVLDEVLPLGVPMFVEKPLCNDAERAQDLANRAPDRLFVMDKWRYHPGVQMLATMARQGDLGEVLGVRTRRVGWGTNHDDVDAVWVLTPHDLSIGLEILGHLPAPRAAVAEWNGTRVGGMQALLGTHPWLAVEVSELSPVNVRVVEVHGREAMARLDGGWDEHVTLVRRGQPEPRSVTIPTPGELPLMAELRAFLEHLRGGPPPRSSAHDGARTVEAIAELRRMSGIEP